jgi:uncharacterized protein (TIGR03437 family)
MRNLLSILLAASAAFAQTALCSRDAGGNQICAREQADTNICGNPMPFPGGVSHFFPSYYCSDVVVEKTSPTGGKLYSLVLAGASQDQPRQLFLDDQGNAIVVGATYSANFPTSTAAAQSRYAGPPPALPSGVAIQAAGDLFLSVVSPAGVLLYSTLLGSSGMDTLLGARRDPGTQLDLLIGAGAADFLAAAGAAAGPVLLTFDTAGRTIVRSLYLPVDSPTAYVAAWRDDGTIGVTTPRAIFAFQRDGRLVSEVSLASFGFQYVPAAATDPAGDLWLAGTTAGNQWLVARLAGGVVEAFRWTLPAPPNSVFLNPIPFFGPNGLTYFSGSGYVPLQSTTTNAILRTPCSPYSFGMVAVLSAQGEVRMLSYFPEPASSFSANADSTVSAIVSSGRRVLVDLESHPKLACAIDPFRSYATNPFGAGQIVRARGGNFGPAAPLTATAGDTGRFPKSLGGLSVQVAGIDAPILSASSGDVVFAIPFGAPEGDAVPVNVMEDGHRSADLAIAVRSLAPLSLEPVINPDGTTNSVDHPARWGSFVIVFLTGAGNSSPPLEDGQISPGPLPLALPASVSFDIFGPVPEPGTVLYAGPSPGLIAGLTQVNIHLPPARPYPYGSILPHLTIGGIPVFLLSVWVE